MDYQITGLSPALFQPLYGLSDKALRAQNILRYKVDKNHKFPDRIEMRDGQVGETMLLLNHCHQPAISPYLASHAIFVREGAKEKYDAVNTIPEIMQTRVLSLRAFDDSGMIVEADIAQSAGIHPLIQRLLVLPGTHYIHAHNAKQRCYVGLITPVVG